MGHPGMPTLPLPRPTFWHLIFPPYFGAKLVSIIFFPQTWRSIVSVDITKACLIHVWYSVWSFIEKTSVKQSIKQQVCSKRQTYPHAYGTLSYRARLYQVHIHPGLMYLPLIKPRFTEPYYTRTVLAIEKCRHAQIPRADVLTYQDRCTSH